MTQKNEKRQMKNISTIFLLIGAFLVIISMILPSITSLQTVLLQENFETGSLSVWNTFTTPGETISVSSSNVHSGSFSAELTTDGSNSSEFAYIYRTFGERTTVYTELWYKISGSLPTVPYHYTPIFYHASGGDPVKLEIVAGGGAYNWRLRYIANHANTSTSYSSPSVNLGVWYKIELYLKTDISNGEIILDINDVNIATISGIANDDYGNAWRISVGEGWSWGQTAHIIYVDDVVVYDGIPSTNGGEPPPDLPIQYKLVVLDTTYGSLTLGGGLGVGVYQYDKGVSVVITAVADTNYYLEYFTLDEVNVGLGTNEQYTVTMDSDHKIGAIFTAIQPTSVTYIVTTLMSGTGSGSVTPNVGEHTYLKDSQVVFTATSDIGSYFDSWKYDEIFSKTNPLTLVINRDLTIEATFTLLDITSTNNTTVDVGTQKTPTRTQQIYNNGFFYIGAVFIISGLIMRIKRRDVKK